MNSQHTTSPITDAVFDVKQVFPNQRADLLNGEWHAFLESFEGVMPSQLSKTNIKVYDGDDCGDSDGGGFYTSGWAR